MSTSDEITAEPFYIQSGGHIRYLGYVVDLSDNAPVEDWFVTNAGGQISWATTLEGAATMCTAAGYALEEYAFDQDMFEAGEVVELDGLVAKVGSPMKPSVGDCVFKAWMFFEGLAESVGETFHHDKLLHARLEDSYGIEDGVLVSLFKQPLRRALRWSDLEIEALRRDTRAGLDMLARHIAPNASA